jgi:hypothetical protein
LLKALTKTLADSSRDEQMSKHLGYDKYAVEGRNQEKLSKTIVTARR